MEGRGEKLTRSTALLLRLKIFKIKAFHKPFHFYTFQQFFSADWEHWDTGVDLAGDCESVAGGVGSTLEDWSFTNPFDSIRTQVNHVK